MNKYSENYEKEVSLAELLSYCLRNWRWVVVSMITLAALAGGYKYLSVQNSNQLKRETLERLGNGTSEEVTINPNVQFYQLAMKKSEENIKKSNDYLENSVIMQLDSNHLQTGTLSFYLDFQEDDNNTLGALLTAYKSYVNDGGLVEFLYEENGNISKYELQYLISFSSDKIEIDPINIDVFNSSEQSSIGQLLTEFMSTLESFQIQMPLSKQHVFQIQIIALDEDMCELYLKRAEEAILNYSKILQTDLSEHNLRLLSSTQIEQINPNIAYYQRQILKEGIMEIKDLRSLRSDLERIINEEGQYITVNPVPTLEEPISSTVKFMLVGLVIGALLAGFLLMLFYLVSNKLQNTNRFEREYGIKLLGHITMELGCKRWFGFVDHWVYQLEEGAYANLSIDEQIGIVVANIKAVICENESLKKVMLVGTISEKDVNTLCTILTEKIGNIEFSSYKQIIISAASLEELKDYDGVLFIEKRGVSISKFIQGEIELVSSRKVDILGAVVL